LLRKLEFTADELKFKEGKLTKIKVLKPPSEVKIGRKS